MLTSEIQRALVSFAECSIFSDFLSFPCMTCDKQTVNVLISQFFLLKMSVVPHGAFAAHKVRQNENKIKNEGQGELWDMSLTKYSSKYMNSVWGMYNKYSVHNLKKNIDEKMSACMAQPEMVGPSKPVEKPTDYKTLSLLPMNFVMKH